MEGFKKFLLRGNLIELAVAVVIGAVFSDLVKSVSRAFIDPLIALLGGKPDLGSLSFTINKTVFPHGVFLTALINFLITATIVYFLVVLPFKKLLERMTQNEEATEQDCPFCHIAIPIAASRCGFCTSELPAPAQA